MQEYDIELINIKFNWKILKDQIAFKCYEENVTDLLNEMIDDINQIKNFMQEKEAIKNINIDDEMLKIAKECLLALKCDRAYIYKNKNDVTPGMEFAKYLKQYKDLGFVYVKDAYDLSSIAFLFEDYDKAKPILEKFIKEREEIDDKSILKIAKECLRNIKANITFITDEIELGEKFAVLINKKIETKTYHVKFGDDKPGLMFGFSDEKEKVISVLEKFIKEKENGR